MFRGRMGQNLDQAAGTQLVVNEPTRQAGDPDARDRRIEYRVAIVDAVASGDLDRGEIPRFVDQLPGNRSIAVHEFKAIMLDEFIQRTGHAASRKVARRSANNPLLIT